MRTFTILCQRNGKFELVRVKANSAMSARHYVTIILHAKIITIE